LLNKKNTTSLILIIILALFITSCGSSSNSQPVGMGNISGVVNDAVTSIPLAGVSIAVTDSEGTLIASATTDSSGVYNFELTAEQAYTLEYSVASHYTETYSNIAVLVNEENILEAVLQINDSITGTGTVSGILSNAITGLAVVGATLNFRAGIQTRFGTIVNTTTTSSSGSYQISTLETGNYTCEIILAGFVTDYVTILVLGGQTVSNQNPAISPVLLAGETRIVLSWGETPEDLDSHLTGPLSDGAANRFHIFFASRGSLNTVPFAGLDVDDVSSFGPETITITSQFQGTYRYSIHDFSSSSLLLSPGSTVLASSGAKVTVFQGSAAPRVFNVPTGVGVLWTVFELNGTTITPLNTMGDVTGGSLLIQSISEKNDAYIFNGVPLVK